MPQTLPLTFAFGVMLGVMRGPAQDVHGDTNRAPSHMIGPAAMAWQSGQATHGTAGPRDLRNETIFDITAPPGSDVRKADRLLVPPGVLTVAGSVLLHVLAEPECPTNAFTGWQPFTRIHAVFYS
ncbi:hypothetical protein [Nocardia terpenica]|uniref:Uncharacterized protein n=1 Tax=Nocardia terpenica TaxID=455432 RepID=A0A164H1X0_9NOCA|nr:hypothetical protein [Nocardia terpenica]KZM68132.1 hypothetical protein AWN90_09325 [Nocardia terpenica]NQE89010.1 hypothetical protein [Nocardia terpenica]